MEASSFSLLLLIKFSFSLVSKANIMQNVLSLIGFGFLKLGVEKSEIISPSLGGQPTPSILLLSG